MQDEIIRMAREAISDTISQHDQMLKRLWCIAYEEGQKAEREACAKVCLEADVHPDHGEVAGDFLAGHIWGCEDCAAAIRARGSNAG